MSQSPAKFERLNEIIQILRETPEISIAQLSKQMFTSKSTLRRDLIELENSNIIRRHYGTVQLLQGNNLEFTYKKDVTKTHVLNASLVAKLPRRFPAKQLSLSMVVLPFSVCPSFYTNRSACTSLPIT